MGKELSLNLITNFFECRLNTAIWYAQARTVGQLQNQNSFSNLLAFPNRDRILIRGLNEAFRENSVNIPVCRALRSEVWPLRHRENSVENVAILRVCTSSENLSTTKPN